MRGVWMMAALASCGRIDFDPLASHDGNADACILGAFGAPRSLVEVNTIAEEFGPWLSDDRLELMFTSMVTGTYLIYRSQRASRDLPFDAPVVFSPAPAPGDADSDDPWLTADGLTMLYDGHNAGAGDLDIFVATRGSIASPFANPTPVSELDTAAADSGPTLTADDLTLVFRSDRQGTSDLFLATRAQPSDTFGQIAPIASLSTAANECCASISANGQTLVYTSDAGSPGLPHLMIATRSGDDFIGATLLDPDLETIGPVSDPYITHDGNTIVYAAIPPNGSYDLYIADRTCM